MANLYYVDQMTFEYQSQIYNANPNYQQNPDYRTCQA